ncbi:MAG: quinolinate synthase NadA [Candidatus Izemoplasmatales bacterium]|jgi:quinolinate synthase|nr:quinolinate synthase NadA [Candidatus Izemoplasmatales bacterium]
MLRDDIIELKKAKDAIILAHYYQDAEVQDIADYVGDSLELSRIAAKTLAKIIVFCGVNFMAETAKILSPDKKVLLPVQEAKCPMAMMISPKELEAYKKDHPNRVIICYVNSYAEIKAMSDICVTSSNAEKIIMAYKDRPMLYIPDKNLGMYLKDKYHLDIDLWHGFCCIHNRLTVKMVNDMKIKHPNALVLVHPEAPLSVIKVADFVGSTKQIIEYASQSSAVNFIIGTEKGILHPLEKANPKKVFHILTPDLACYDMKLTTIEDVYRSLKNENFEITVPEAIQKKAYESLRKMLEMS